jgi:hypothetical protein
MTLPRQAPTRLDVPEVRFHAFGTVSSRQQLNRPSLLLLAQGLKRKWSSKFRQLLASRHLSERDGQGPGPLPPATPCLPAARAMLSLYCVRYRLHQNSFAQRRAVRYSDNNLLDIFAQLPIIASATKIENHDITMARICRSFSHLLVTKLRSPSSRRSVMELPVELPVSPSAHRSRSRQHNPDCLALRFIRLCLQVHLRLTEHKVALPLHDPPQAAAARRRPR